MRDETKEYTEKIKAYIDAYDEITDKRDPFTLGDMEALIKMSEKPGDYDYTLVSNCLYYAYVKGYKEALER